MCARTRARPACRLMHTRGRSGTGLRVQGRAQAAGRHATANAPRRGMPRAARIRIDQLHAPHAHSAVLRCVPCASQVHVGTVQRVARAARGWKLGVLIMVAPRLEAIGVVQAGALHILSRAKPSIKASEQKLCSLQPPVVSLYRVRSSGEGAAGLAPRTQASSRAPIGSQPPGLACLCGCD